MQTFHWHHQQLQLTHTSCNFQNWAFYFKLLHQQLPLPFHLPTQHPAVVSSPASQPSHLYHLVHPACCNTIQGAKSQRVTQERRKQGPAGGKGSSPAHLLQKHCFAAFLPQEHGLLSGLTLPHSSSSLQCVDMPPRGGCLSLWTTALNPTKPLSSTPGNSAVSLNIWGFLALTCYFACFKPMFHQNSTISPGPARWAATGLSSRGSCGQWLLSPQRDCLAPLQGVLLANLGLNRVAYGTLCHIIARVFASFQNRHSLWAVCTAWSTCNGSHSHPDY